MKRIAALALLALAAPLSHGDVLLLDGIEISAATRHLRPSRGMSMASVEANFGAASQQHPPVGDPPITRWDYPGFVVYFEYQYVIHAVARQ